jgi:hypothetical protein
MVLHVQEMADAWDKGAPHIAEIPSQPIDLVIGHDCPQPGFASQEQDGTVKFRQNVPVTVSLGEIDKVAKQISEEGWINLPETGGEENKPLARDRWHVPEAIGKPQGEILFRDQSTRVGMSASHGRIWTVGMASRGKAGMA